MGLRVAIEETEESASGNPAIVDSITKGSWGVGSRSNLVIFESRFARARLDEICRVGCEGTTYEAKVNLSPTESVNRL